MRLPAGTKLGPYEILAPLGAGGMGEVYRARDTRLGRDVAIKVLPQHLCANPEVRARFEREAKTVSSLNHPNICTLFDVGVEGDADYLVMELVEGETLSARLEKGPLPAGDVLRIGGQIADALDRAHRAGVVHRDLKPANIMLTKTGAKLMDFGLARAGTGLAGPGSASRSLTGMTQSPTVAAPLTAEGTILGTFQYMAPEQLEGREADTRSDVWALGCVLYEMTTARRAFDGRSQASLIAAIMHTEPPALAQAAPLSPPALERIVRRCMAKDPDDRYQSTSDLAFALREIGTGAISGISERPASSSARPGRANAGFSRGVLAGVAAALVLGTLLALVFGAGIGGRLGLTRPDKRAIAPARTFDLTLPDSLPLVFIGAAPLSVEQPAMALSPDGIHLVYITRTHTGTMLAVHDLKSRETSVLAGTEGGFAPCFSPDGGAIAFFSGNELKRLSLSGGSPQTLSAVDEPWGLTWVDASRLFVTGRQGLAPVFVDASTGAVDSIANGPRQAGTLTPDGAGMLYSGYHILRYFDLKTRKNWVLTARGLIPADAAVPPDALYGFGPTLLPSGDLLYVQPGGAGTLVATRVDTKTLRPTGQAIPIATSIRYAEQGLAQYVVSRDGIAIMAVTQGSGRMNFVAYSNAGAVDSLALPGGDYGTFEISPDGSQIVLVDWPVNGPPDLVLYDVARRTSERLARGSAVMPMPSWAPDGRSVLVNAYGTSTAPRKTLRYLASGGGTGQTIASGQFIALATAPDGRHVLRSDMTTVNLVAVDSLRSPGMPIPGINALANFSPDGAWIACTSIAGSRSEVYVLPLAAQSARYRVSVNGGEEPRWSRDGRSIVYRYGTTWFEAAFTPGAPPVIGLPKKLFEGPFINVPGYSHALFPDGRHLLLRIANESETHRLTAVTELARLLDGAARRP